MRDVRNPVGWRRMPVPAKTGNRSVVCDMGVRFEQDCDDPDLLKQRWYCMGSESCRAESYI